MKLETMNRIVFWVGIPVCVGSVLALCWKAERECGADPCAQHASGYVQTVDDRGRPAMVPGSWCARYKPGREPDGGSR